MSSRDYAKWRPLAEQGDPSAQFFLGRMYAEGQGVPQDYSHAVRWFTAAADQGDPAAQTNLGFMYEAGRGVPQDQGLAVRYFRAAAGQGYAHAQFGLAKMYEEGRAVRRDLVAAHMWFTLAAENGAKHAVQKRDLIARLMTPADISEAQRRARVCMASGYRNCD